MSKFIVKEAALRSHFWAKDNFSSNVLNNRTAAVCDTFAEATKYLDYVMDRSGLDPDNLLAYTMEYAQGVPGMTDRDWVLVTYWTVGRP